MSVCMVIHQCSTSEAGELFWESVNHQELSFMNDHDKINFPLLGEEGIGSIATTRCCSR